MGDVFPFSSKTIKTLEDNPTAAASWSVIQRRRRRASAMGRDSNSASSNNVLGHLSSFLVLLACFPSFSSPQSPPDPCSLVQCGQGTCKASNSFPFLECECYPGWIKPQILMIPVPFCVIPNCNVTMECGGTAPPPPPAPVALPPLNLTDPCFLAWCGEGQCVRDEAAHNHACNCNDGSDNFLGLKGLPCFKECSLGADCKGVSLGPPQPPPPPSTSPAPPSPGKGSGGAGTFSRNYRAFLPAAAATAIALILI